MINYSRLRNLDIANFLKHEIVSTSFYLTKDGELRKSPKSKLVRELKNLLEKPCPVEIPDSDLKSVVVIDFMAYAWKISTRKMCWLRMKIFLKNCGEPFQVYLWAVPESSLTYTWDIVSSKARGIRGVNLIQLKQISHPSSSNYLLKWTDFGRPHKIK